MDSLRNLDTAFQKVRIHAMVTVLASLGFSIAVSWWAFDYANTASQRIYVLSNGAVTNAQASSVQANREAEAKHHVRYYHDLVFNISPDPRSIEYNVQRAWYLGDGSIKLPYEKNKENNFYNQLIGGNMRQEFREDSIHVNMKNMPYKAIIYGKVTITRSSSRLTKTLVTSCELVDVNRSDNNSNGFLMQNFTILENKRLTSESR
jgi:conjugative transposon TraK protein